MFSVSLILRTRDPKRRGKEGEQQPNREPAVVSPSNYISAVDALFPLSLSLTRSFEFTRVSIDVEGERRSNIHVSTGDRGSGGGRN